MNFNVSELRTISISLEKRRNDLKSKAENYQYHHGMSDARAMCCFNEIRDIDDVLKKLGVKLNETT